jgi:coenzyme F420-reducing hydrogenase delta subunit
MCTGRIDPSHILRAFSKGADGVLIGGCRLHECNYTTQGNFHALNMALLMRKILGHIGLNPERLKIDFMSGSEGNVYVDVVNEFTSKIKELGPLGQSEGLVGKDLELKLKAVTNLVPYIRLVLNERLRVHFDTREEYEDFYSSEGLNRLFGELIIDKIAVSEIMLILRESPLTTGEMSKVLGLTPSEISRHLNSTARHGLVRFEDNKWRLAIA